MAKPKKKSKVVSQEEKKKYLVPKKDLFDKFDSFFEKKGKYVLWISGFLTLAFTLLLFNVRISEGGDDSAYILRAFDFVKEHIFPSFQGPLYPLMLSLFVWIFGINIFVLKFLSVIFIIVHLFLFYKAFYNKIPSFITAFVLFIIAFNASLLYYASQTYSEVFFMMLQAALFYYFFKYIIEKQGSSIKNYLILGLLLLLLGLTRTIGYSALLAVLIYLLTDKKWKGALITLAGFIVFYLVIELIKRVFFGSHSNQYQGQLGILLQVDPYDPSKGIENFKGFLERFWGNSNLYLSKHIYASLGLKADITKTSAFMTAFTYILFFVSFIVSVRKNKYLAFTGIYLLTLIGATFFMLQTRWDQDRLILIFLPLILVFITSGFYYLLKLKRLRIFKFLLPLIFVMLFFTSLKVMIEKVTDNNDVLVNSIAGNQFYGMTPDWINYIKMSQWAGKNLPDTANIACRKASISFIYGKRKFFGITSVPSEDADTLLNNLKKNKISYVLMGSLRMNPKQKTEYTITTIKRYLYFIQQKYPQALSLVNTIGTDEQAYMFKINYDKAVKPK